MATFDARYGWQYGDFSASEYNLVYNEVYDLTAHLLDTYNNSGKTFILQNWEGDNALGENASAQKVMRLFRVSEPIEFRFPVTPLTFSYFASFSSTLVWALAAVALSARTAEAAKASGLMDDFIVFSLCIGC